MRKAIWVGLALGWFSLGSCVAATPAASTPTAPKPTHTESEPHASPTAALPTLSSDPDELLVMFVVDGDTILLENGESVRYIGIDTPETHHPTQGLECFGPEATERNRELVEGKPVRLEADTTDRDVYGRLLRYVYVEDVFVNAVLVEEGYAYSYYRPPDTRYYQELLELELEAEAAGRGMWAACSP